MCEGTNITVTISSMAGGEFVPEIPQQAQLEDQSALSEHHPEVCVPHVQFPHAVLAERGHGQCGEQVGPVQTLETLHPLGKDIYPSETRTFLHESEKCSGWQRWLRLLV